MVWGVFSWNTFGPLIKVEQCLNATGYPNIIANQVHPFMVAVCPSVNGFLQQDDAPYHKARIVHEWFHKHDNEVSFCSGLHSQKISIQLSICGMRWNELFGVETHYQPT